MAAWLLKVEPSIYSADDLEREGTTRWDGVANNAAVKHMRAVREGDACIIYHTGRDKAAAAVAEAASDPYQHNGTVAFDVRFVRHINPAVTLAQVKADPRFIAFDLVRQPRLSVMPVDAVQWRFLTGDDPDAQA